MNTPEKEFVPYELAVKLKALGFDEPCFAVYFNTTQQLYFDKYINEFTKDVRTLAPLYQQAFRWFREKHGLLSLTDHKTSHGWFYRVYFGDNEWYGGFVKYKEAELACLTKLIEITEAL